MLIRIIFFFCSQKGPVSSFFSCLGGVSPTCLFKTDLSLTVRCFPSISFVQYILVHTHPIVTFTHIHYSHSLPYILRLSIHSSQSLRVMEPRPQPFKEQRHYVRKSNLSTLYLLCENLLPAACCDSKFKYTEEEFDSWGGDLA